MRLASLRTENFAGLVDREYVLRSKTGSAAQVVLVTGPPASGKTRFLEAIIAAKEAIAPYGRPARLELEARDQRRPVTLDATWEIDDGEREAFRIREREMRTHASAGPLVDPVVLRGPMRDLLEHCEHGSQWAKMEWHIENERDAELILTKRGLSRKAWEDAKLAWSKAIGVHGPERKRFLDAYVRASGKWVGENEGPAPNLDQPTPADSAPRKHELPTYALQIAAEPVELDPDATLSIPMNVAPSLALPFTGETSPAALAALKASSAVVEREGPDPNVDETLMLRSPLTTQAGNADSFRDQVSPVAIPILSIDEYAKLRAKLAVKGEDDPETWREFGILSPAAKVLLQSRFVAYFRQDPGAQKQFVERLTELKSGKS